MQTIKQTIDALPVTDFFTVLPSLEVLGETIVLVDIRTDKEKRYLKAIHGERVAWQGFVVGDYLKSMYKIESGHIISCTGYSDYYGKDVSEQIEKATKEVSRLIMAYRQGLKNLAAKGQGGGISYMPAMITISNYGWDVSGIKPITVSFNS